MDIADIVPGGIRPSDRWHIRTNDNSCSRCRRQVPENDVPLMLWRDGEGGRSCDMLIFCSACLAQPAVAEAGEA